MSRVRVRKTLLSLQQPEAAQEDPHWRETVHVRGVREKVQPRVLEEKTPQAALLHCFPGNCLVFFDLKIDFIILLCIVLNLDLGVCNRQPFR